MNSKSILTLLMFFFLAFNAFASGQIDYAKTYLEARQKAIEENKPYIIIFENDQCDPCHWMEQNTLKDKRVKSLINEKYIAVKVDIDDFDGYALKKYYEIDKLPSLLMFSPKGAEQQRIEQALTASELIQLLKDPNHKPQLQNVVKDNKKEASKKAPDKPKHHESKATTNYYAVQLGVFSNRKNAKELANRIDRISSEEVLIKQEAGLFKVFSGRLNNKAEAEGHLRKLKDYGYEGFIKSISITSKL